MRILFAGTPPMAVPALRLIHEKFDICGVLTATDKKGGRGNAILFPAIKRAALDLNLTIFQADVITDELISRIQLLAPDLLVVVAFGVIFKKKFLDIFSLGGVNVHPSLLPAWRGTSPIPATILSGSDTAGITIQNLAEKMDAGDILLQKEVALTGRETTESLTRDLSFVGAEMLAVVLDGIKTGSIQSIPQDHSCATFCKLIKKDDGLISWQDDAIFIDRKIRAYIPWPLAFTFFKGKRLVIHEANLYSADINKTQHAYGYVMGMDIKHGILVCTGNGVIGLTKVQIQTKGIMDFKSFLNGHKDLIGWTLGE